MKKTISFSILLVSLSLTLSHRAIADVSEESQRNFEAEIESIDMGEMKGQTHTAEQEAIEQEQSVAQQKRTLQELKKERAHVERTAKARIATAEWKRQKALKEQAKYSAEIQKLQRQIDGMKATVARHEARAQDADDLAASEEAELEDLHQTRNKIQAAKHPAIPRAKRVDAYNDMEVAPW